MNQRVLKVLQPSSQAIRWPGLRLSVHSRQHTAVITCAAISGISPETGKSKPLWRYVTSQRTKSWTHSWATSVIKLLQQCHLTIDMWVLEELQWTPKWPKKHVKYWCLWKFSSLCLNSRMDQTNARCDGTAWNDYCAAN